MLGTISKKLRILGFDCTYSSTIDDEDLILIAKKEGRIIITKDVHLANKAKKLDVTTIGITAPVEKDQLVQIAKNMGWKKYEFVASNARCPVCNGVLHSRQKDQIEAKIPPRIAENINEFWICQGCSHVYWEGTHIKKLQRFIAEINEQL